MSPESAFLRVQPQKRKRQVLEALPLVPGRTVSSLNLLTKALTPRETVFGDRSPEEVMTVERCHAGWVPIAYAWCPYEKRQRHQDSVCSWWRSCEDTAGGQPSASQARSLRNSRTYPCLDRGLPGSGAGTRVRSKPPARGIARQHPGRARAPWTAPRAPSDGSVICSASVWSCTVRACRSPGTLRPEREDRVSHYVMSAKLCTTLEASVSHRRPLACQGRHTEEPRGPGRPRGSWGGI